MSVKPETETLPPWSGEHETMLRWLDKKLDAKLVERHVKAWEDIATSKRLTPHEWAMLMASEGNVEPLRRLLIELTDDADVARFVNLPKLARGERWRPAHIRKKPVQPPEIATWAKIIREIWNEHYGPKQRRHPDWTAEDFAFAIFMMDAEVKGFDPTDENAEPHKGKRWTDRAADQNKRGKK